MNSHHSVNTNRLEVIYNNEKQLNKGAKDVQEEVTARKRKENGTYSCGCRLTNFNDSNCTNLYNQDFISKNITFEFLNFIFTASLFSVLVFMLWTRSSNTICVL